MRRVLTSSFVVALALALGGAARGQFFNGSSYASPGFGQPDGLYTSLTVPGMGSGGPSVMLYFPSGSSGSFTPSPMAYGGIAGVRVPVAGSPGSLLLATPGGPAAPPPPVSGGGLGLPTPRRPAPTAAPARPAATRKAAAQPKAAPKAEADAPAEAKGDGKSTLRARRGIR